MKLTEALIRKLQRLCDGEALPLSQVPAIMAQQLAEEGILGIEYHGSRRSVKVISRDAFKVALAALDPRLCNLENALSIITAETRAQQAILTGDSKGKVQRSCPGFLVSSFDHILCKLNGKAFDLCEMEGSALFVFDWQHFVISKEVLVIGIENVENFRMIRHHGDLFQSQLKPEESGIVFVSRYPQTLDLRHWLMQISNRYVHFGDFDLAGISIFINEYQKYLSDRASFLIPSDIEARLVQGSTRRYLDQESRYSGLSSDITELQELINLIRNYRRAYDQEGYINSLYSNPTLPSTI